MSSTFAYNNRSHAGKVLADIVVEHQIEDPIILALPRGGVPIAKEIAEKLKVPLDVLMVRKIGSPFNPEYGIGALSEDLIPLFNAGEFLHWDDLESEVKEIIEDERGELRRRVKLYRGDRTLPDVRNKNVILVDDGLATGVTAAAAASFIKTKKPSKVILAVPVGPQRISEIVRVNVDEIICPYTPPNLSGIGLWYHDFNQVSDQEVLMILRSYHEDGPNEISLWPSP